MKQTSDNNDNRTDNSSPLPDDWDGTIGNPGKLGLSLISIVFNAIFLFQHYILYPKPSRKRHDTNTELDRAFKQKLESRLQDMVIKAPPTTYKTKATQRIQELWSCWGHFIAVVICIFVSV